MRFWSTILEMLVENRENAVLVPKTSDTLSLIWASDLVLTRYSTVGLEAVALKKPLIVKFKWTTGPNRLRLKGSGNRGL